MQGKRNVASNLSTVRIGPGAVVTNFELAKSIERDLRNGLGRFGYVRSKRELRS